MDGLKPLFKTWRENSLRENKSQEVKKKQNHHPEDDCVGVDAQTQARAVSREILNERHTQLL